MPFSRTAATAQRRRAYAMVLAYTLCGYIVSVHLGPWVLSQIGVDPGSSNPMAVVCAGMAAIALWPFVLLSWWMAR
jgi:hypothetical protein